MMRIEEVTSEQREKGTLPPVSAIYDATIKDLILMMIDPDLQARPSVDEILRSDAVVRFHEKKKVKSNPETSLPDLIFGKPLDQYKKDYKEKRHLGKGAQGVVVLVKSIQNKEETGEMFAAKRQIDFEDSRCFENMKREQEMLMKMDHPNIVRMVDSYENAK